MDSLIWIRRPLYTATGIALLALMLFPVYWMVNTSLQKSGNTLSTELFPMVPDLDGYIKAVTEQGANLITSLVVSLCTVALSLTIAAPAAYALARLRSRWVDAILFIILVSQMIPGIVIANALYPVYNSLNLLNSIPGLVLADATTGIPFAILLMRSFMLGLPPALVEAACVDGAGPIRTFVSIVVPVSRNAIITAGLFTFLFAWSDFLFALTLTTTKAVRPVTLGIYQYLGTQVSNWQSIMATAVVSSLPAIILLLVAQRFITAGALGGSTK